MHSTCPLQYILERRQQRHAGSECSRSLISNRSGSQTSKWIQCILALIPESPLQNMPRCSSSSNHCAGAPQLLEAMCEEGKARRGWAGWCLLWQLRAKRGMHRGLCPDSEGGSAGAPHAPSGPPGIPDSERAVSGGTGHSPGQHSPCQLAATQRSAKAAICPSPDQGKGAAFGRVRRAGEGGGMQQRIKPKANLVRLGQPGQVWEISCVSLRKLISTCPLAF